MITIIHGDDVTKSRQKLEELTSGKKFQFFDGQKARIEEISDSAASQELFASQKLIVIERFTVLTKQKNFLEFLKTIESNKDIQIILWDDRVTTPTVLKKFASSQVLVFTLPKYFFSFLDGLYPKNGKKASQLLKQLSPSFEDAQIFYSMVKRVRLLLMAKTGDLSQFSETRSMSPWQKQNITKQTRLWQDDALCMFYLALFDLEKGMKTSNLPLPLINHIDILLVNALQ
jgi:DNA polymerase III delta subunit